MSSTTFKGDFWFDNRDIILVIAGLVVCGIILAINLL